MGAKLEETALTVPKKINSASFVKKKINPTIYPVFIRLLVTLFIATDELIPTSFMITVSSKKIPLICRQQF
jgi:hypothetical protein